VVANSRSGASFAQRYFGYPERLLHVVWNGMRVDECVAGAASTRDFRREFFGDGEHRIACMIGHIKPAKDYHLALEAAAELVRMAPEWRVLFLGEALSSAAGYAGGRDSETGDYKNGVMQHFQALGLEQGGKVRFAGARADAHAVLAQCDVQFMTSCREGFPNVVLEGMALGVPVVSTDYSDIRLILPRASQVVASRSPAGIASAIVAASRDREAIAAEQKRWVSEHASIEQAARQMERVYENCLRRDTSPRAA
jgi:glycosyltransferase involved in cell wall biosynthesis